MTVKDYAIVLLVVAMITLVAIQDNMPRSKQFRQEAKELRERTDSLQKRILQYKESQKESNKETERLLFLIDSLYVESEKVRVEYVYLEKERNEKASGIAADSSINNQLEFLTDWLNSRKQSGGVVVGGTTVN